mmetsp:Transcript_62848/g.109501  ORF Transcript_62848/g.109501 Transcript_62848/m.109501 type:complete len:115 (-) Transcript_62848:33-377(-)
MCVSARLSSHALDGPLRSHHGTRRNTDRGGVGVGSESFGSCIIAGAGFCSAGFCRRVRGDRPPCPYRSQLRTRTWHQKALAFENVKVRGREAACEIFVRYLNVDKWSLWQNMII